jgi:hypothetical protein
MIKARSAPPAESGDAPAADPRAALNAMIKARSAPPAESGDTPAADPRAALNAMMKARAAPSSTVAPPPAAAASEPAEAAPANPMLAEMLAKRKMDGGKRPEPSVAAAPIAQPERRPNPCSLEDRRHFVRSMREFASLVRERAAAQNAAVAEAEAAAIALAKYFGEDPKTTPPSKVFDVLRRFNREFNAAVEALRRRKLAAKKSAAAPATPGPAAPKE